jgi:hypothetical protein
LEEVFATRGIPPLPFAAPYFRSFFEGIDTPEGDCFWVCFGVLEPFTEVESASFSDEGGIQRLSKDFLGREPRGSYSYSKLATAAEP